jgi:hypothetical protein
MLDFFHEEIGVRTPMLAKPAAIGQMPRKDIRTQLFAARINADESWTALERAAPLESF